MPDPNEYEDEKSFMEVCIPKVLQDGTAKDNDQAVAICSSMWEKKSIEVEPAIKVGSRHSKIDQDDIQEIHDRALRLGAVSPPAPKQDEVISFPLGGYDQDKSMIAFGSDVKALGETPEGVRLGGHLILFGSPEQTDLSYTRDYFTKDTDFDLEPGQKKDVAVYFHHKQPLKASNGDYIIVKRKIGKGQVELDDMGVLIDAIINNRKEYEKFIAENATKMGWSSGTLDHLMEREPQDNGSNWISAWPIGEASLTPTPAEPRINVIPLKSLMSVIEQPALKTLAEDVGQRAAG